MVISSSLSSSAHKNTESVLIWIHLLELWQSVPGYHTYATQKYLTTSKTRSLAFICVRNIDFAGLCLVSKANPEAPSRPPHVVFIYACLLPFPPLRTPVLLG